MSKVEQKNGIIAIYHSVKKSEKFEDAVRILVELVKTAQEKWPDQRRHLYLDIEGHTKRDGAFDADMWEFVSDFMLDMKERVEGGLSGGFANFFDEAHIPMPGHKILDFKNQTAQRNDIVDVVLS